MKRVGPSIATVLLVLSTALSRASAQDHEAVGGVVRDLRGIAQLGALVELLGPGSAVLAHAYTDDHGRYLLEVPKPGSYQLRISATLLIPALRQNLHILSGSRMLVNVNMNALFEARDWFPIEKRSHKEPVNDWRWTLRSSAERPLLRFVGSTEDEHGGIVSDPKNGATEKDPSQESPSKSRQHQQLSLLSGTGGLLQDGSEVMWRAERQAAKGAMFAVQASISAPPGDESPAVKTALSYGRQDSITHSEFRVTAGFASLPQLGSGGEMGYQAATLATGERIVLGDFVTIDAGTLLSAERLVSSRVSTAPFLRLAVHPSSDLDVIYRYAGSRAAQSLDDLSDDPIAPTPLSDAKGRPVGKLATHQELAVSSAAERDEAIFTIYRDVFATTALEGGGLLRSSGPANLPILANRENGHFVVALVGYTARGLGASWTHSFSAEIKATLEADLGTALILRGSKLPQVQALPTDVVACTRPALSASIDGVVRRTATTFEVRYHWQPMDTVTMINPFDGATDEAYAGLLVKQRLWRGRKLRSVSAVLEASNLLEEGYQPVVGPDGETLFLAQVPRALQAGLTFSF